MIGVSVFGKIVEVSLQLSHSNVKVNPPRSKYIFARGLYVSISAYKFVLV